MTIGLATESVDKTILSIHTIFIILLIFNRNSSTYKNYINNNQIHNNNKNNKNNNNNNKNNNNNNKNNNNKKKKNNKDKDQVQMV